MCYAIFGLKAAPWSHSAVRSAHILSLYRRSMKVNVMATHPLFIPQFCIRFSTIKHTHLLQPWA